MSTPNPVPTQTPTPIDTSASSSFVPSNSTNMTLLGGAVASIIIGILGKYGITFQAGFEAALATLAAAALGYLPKSGRR